MNVEDTMCFEFCKTLLRRYAWRLQYKVRTQYNREHYSIFSYQSYDNHFDEKILSKIYVKYLLDMIPWEKSRTIIKAVILDEKTEKEVAFELHISQQAVNKWKIKGLKILRQNLKHLQI